MEPAPQLCKSDSKLQMSSRPNIVLAAVEQQLSEIHGRPICPAKPRRPASDHSYLSDVHLETDTSLRFRRARRATPGQCPQLVSPVIDIANESRRADLLRSVWRPDSIPRA